MSLDGLYYQHSGKYSVTGALYAVVVGSVIACACAFVYAYIILYCPIVYLNALIALGYGAVIGYMCSAMLKQKKVRSDAVAVGITLLVTSVAYYFHWAVWVWALARRGEEPVPFMGLVGLTIFPNLLWGALRAINVEGAWTLRGSAVSGIALWIVWATELGAIYWCSLKTAFSHMDEHPFCETCEEWGAPDPSVLAVNTGDVGELKRRAEAKDLRYIEELGGPKDGTDFTRMDLFSCQRCGSFYTMDMERVQVTVSGGKSNEKKSRVLHHLLLSPSEAQSIKKLAEKLKPAALDAPPDTTKAEGASA